MIVDVSKGDVCSMSIRRRRKRRRREALLLVRIFVSLGREDVFD